MANATLEKPERIEARTTMAPFTVQADHHRNCDLLLQSIPGCRLRSNIQAGRTAKDAKSGQLGIPQGQAKFLGQLPPIPGMQLTVDPAKLTYKITDPLYADEDFCDGLKSALNRIEGNPFRIEGKLRGVAPLSGTLDVHRMKTLCREIGWLLDSGDAQVVKGARPTVDEVDALPGHYLQNPGSQVPNGQPQFEKNFPAWVERLHAAGG